MGLKNMCNCLGSLDFVSDPSFTVHADICPFCHRQGSTVTLDTPSSFITFSSDFVSKPTCNFQDGQATLSTHGNGTVTFGSDTFPVTFSLDLFQSNAFDSFSLFIGGFLSDGSPFLVTITEFLTPEDMLTITNCHSASFDTNVRSGSTNSNLANGFTSIKKMFANGKWKDL